MKQKKSSKDCHEFLTWFFRRMNNQDGASLMAALLFFVLCGVGASILLASTTASAGKIRQLPAEDQKRYAADSAAAFLRDELQKTENIVKIKEVIIEDSRDDDISDVFDCYYVGSSKNQDNESTWEQFYSSSSGNSVGTWSSGAESAVLDSMIVDIYKKNEYMNQTSVNDDFSVDGSGKSTDTDESDSQSNSEYKDFTLSVRKSGSTTDTVDPLQTAVRLYMADNYKITAIVSDTATPDSLAEERIERRLELEALTSKKRSVTVEIYDSDDDSTDDGDASDDDEEDNSYTITTTTIITTIKWQNGTIEKELLEQ